jgi:hypothetical protein
VSASTSNSLCPPVHRRAAIPARTTRGMSSISRHCERSDAIAHRRTLG